MIRCRAPFCGNQVTETWEVCRLCWDYREHWRDELVPLWIRAHAALVPGGRSGPDVKVKLSKPGSAMPLRETVLTAMYDALTRVYMWAETLLDRGCSGALPALGTAREGFIFDSGVLICAAYDETLDGTSLAGDYYLDIYKAYWRLLRSDRHGPDSAALRGCCPRCGRMSLWERHAGECVACLTCGVIWSQAAFALVDPRARETSPKREMSTIHNGKETTNQGH